MSRFRFPSLGRPDYAYAIDSTFEQARGLPVAHWARECKTYNDNMIAHTPHYHVQSENLEDYLYSLCSFLLLPRGDEEYNALFESLYFRWPTRVSRPELDFFHSVRYNKDKQSRYYSLNERKVSASDSKRYDKRWEEIPSYADGGMKAMLMLLNPGGHKSLLECYGAYLDIDDYLRSLELRTNDKAHQLLKVTDVEYIYTAITGLMEAYQSTARAKRIVKGYDDRLEREVALPVAAELSA